jgi:flavodoxin
MDKPITTRPDGLRRAILLALSGGATASPTRGQAQSMPSTGSTLVAYLSRSGNTRLVARQIARATSAELFEIETTQPYPEDYRQAVDQAKRESDAGIEPSLKNTVARMESYRTVFLGFPIWGMTAPPPIRSFLAQHDLAGKTIVPFITHGGYGTGASLTVVSQRARGARVVEAFVMQADQERDTLERVTRWLGRRGTRR